MSVDVVVKHQDWNNIHPLALDNIAMKTTTLTIFVCCKVVIIHEKYSNQIGDYLIISYNIRFLSGTLL